MSIGCQTQISNRHSVSSLLHVEPRLIFTRRTDYVLLVLELVLISSPIFIVVLVLCQMSLLVLVIHIFFVSQVFVD